MIIPDGRCKGLAAVTLGSSKKAIRVRALALGIVVAAAVKRLANIDPSHAATILGHSQFPDLVAKARSAPQAPGPITVPSQKARQEPVRNESRHHEVEFLSKELADARREREDLRMAAEACEARESKIKSRFEKEQAAHLDSKASVDRQLSAFRVEVQEDLTRLLQPNAEVIWLDTVKVIPFDSLDEHIRSFLLARERSRRRIFAYCLKLAASYAQILLRFLAGALFCFFFLRACA